MTEKVCIQIKTSRTQEETPLAMAQILSSLTSLVNRVFLTYKRGVPFSLEIAYHDSLIHFYIVIPKQFQPLLESQILSQYPKALINRVPDYLPQIMKKELPLKIGRIKLRSSYYLPLKTFEDGKDVDLLSSVLGVLSKLPVEDSVVIQYMLIPTTSGGWQSSGAAATQITTKKADGTVTTSSHPQAAEITRKISQNGFRTSIRILVKSTNPTVFSQVASSFSVYNNATGNSFVIQRTYPWEKSRLLNAILNRSRKMVPRHQVLNIAELASLYHFPTMPLANIPNISWTKTILSDAPENLPVAAMLSPEEKPDVNFFARTVFKNSETVFGIKRKDRRRHMYIIGKTGTGKSTLIANMVINDMRNGEGVAVIDPHGDLIETILDYVPANRINDVVYLNPGNAESIFHLNPLEAGDTHKDLVSSGIVAIFQKLYANSWGPRLEYILRNTILSLLDYPNATLLMVPLVLTDPTFRAKVVARLKDPVMINFWTKEFDSMQERLRTEAISPILNKVGQFLSSQTIRTIVGNPKSTVDLRKIMDEKKILLFNLSQGKLGEDNSALLGAMTITKLQLAAMSRVDTPEEQRKDFFLYVDEFQNFATTSFIKILSEARKYRLDLILANQYIAQLPEELMHAIFGNVGSLMTFIVGAQDATYLAKEYGERFKEEDLLALGNYQALIKLYIDGITTSPFMCRTLPLPKSVNKNREKVIKVSSERYSTKIKDVDSGYMDNSPDIPKKDIKSSLNNNDKKSLEKPRKAAQKLEDKEEDDSQGSLPESGEFVLDDK